MKGYRVAVVGADEMRGAKIVEELKKQKFPVKDLLLLLPKGSEGNGIKFNNHDIAIKELRSSSFKKVDLAFFSAGEYISKKYVSEAVKCGATVIDCTNAYRMDKDVPLIVPEVNVREMKNHKGIISSPNASAIFLSVVLDAMRKKLGIKRVIVSTYQPVSEEGLKAVEELRTGSVNSDIFPRKGSKRHCPIAYNVIPQIDEFQENGYTIEEMNLISETRKILNLKGLKISATCVRVPVNVGTSQSVYIECTKKASVKDVKEIISSKRGVVVKSSSSDEIYPMPIYAEGKSDIFVGRIRRDRDFQNGFHMWIVSDNLLKGASYNAVQIAKELIKG